MQNQKTYIQGKINKVSHESGIEDCHIVARFGNTYSTGSRFERVGCTKLLGKSPNYLPFKKFLLPHAFETPMHLWDQKFQKFQHRNPLKNGSLLENVMKEGERVLFQPLKLKEML